MNAVPAPELPARPFYFLRHGETESNVNRTVAGWLDVALTPLGLAQAKAAAAALAGRGITSIHASALTRARDTADRVALVLRLPVDVVPELGERRWGVLEGKPRVLRVPGVTPPGAETPEQFEARVRTGLARVARVPGLPLVVAHSGVFRVLCRLLGLPARENQVANALPVLFVPPDAASGVWRMEPLLPAAVHVDEDQSALTSAAPK